MLFYAWVFAANQCVADGIMYSDRNNSGLEVGQFWEFGFQLWII